MRGDRVEVGHVAPNLRVLVLDAFDGGGDEREERVELVRGGHLRRVCGVPTRPGELFYREHVGENSMPAVITLMRDLHTCTAFKRANTHFD